MTLPRYGWTQDDDDRWFVDSVFRLDDPLLHQYVDVIELVQRAANGDETCAAWLRDKCRTGPGVRQVLDESAALGGPVG